MDGWIIDGQVHNKWTDRQINGQMNEIYHLLG